MLHPSPSHSVLVNQPLSSLHQAPRVVQRTSVEMLATATTDIQMRCVAELEERYWHTHFSTQAYYVAGRGYDQYQPAFKLGWKSALQNPDASFEDFALLLESQWVAQCASSLLPWREVHVAIREAWMHARQQMQALHEQPPTMVCGREVAGLVQPLYRQSLLLSAELQRLDCMLVSDLMQQIIDRHVRLMQSIARGLQALGAVEATTAGLVNPWVRKIQGKWSSLKLRLTDPTPEELLALCERNERNLLSAYQAVLSHSLPHDAKDLLQQQAKQLQIHIHKLCWARENWVLERSLRMDF